MGAIGSIIDSAVDSTTGKSSGTTLQDFLSRFSSSEGVWAKTIDPFSTFDVTMKFFPYGGQEDASKKSVLDSLTDSLMSSAKSTVKSAANNVIGGLLGSIMNGRVNIMKKHDDNPEFRYATFMEYLASANLIVGADDGWVGEGVGQTVSPLTLQLGPYCQEITLPNLEVPQGGNSTNAIGDFPINGMFVKADANTIQLKIINTKVPLHERIFYPWMREVTLNYWSYDSQPYTTATITVDFTKHCDLKYVFCGCRPTKITTQQPTQDASSANMTRDVSFIFDYMFVTSSLTNCESLTDKLLSTGKSLVNSSLKMVNA